MSIMQMNARSTYLGLFTYTPYLKFIDQDKFELGTFNV